MPNSKYTMNYNSAKNRIYISFSGTLNEQEAPGYVNDFKSIADRTKSGFTVCIDAANAGVHSAKTDEIFAEARDYCVKKGIKATATVIGASAIYKLQLKRTLSEIGNDLFATVEEADKYLDTL